MADETSASSSSGDEQEPVDDSGAEESDASGGEGQGAEESGASGGEGQGALDGTPVNDTDSGGGQHGDGLSKHVAAQGQCATFILHTHATSCLLGLVLQV